MVRKSIVKMTPEQRRQILLQLEQDYKEVYTMIIGMLKSESIINDSPQGENLVLYNKVLKILSKDKKYGMTSYKKYELC